MATAKSNLLNSVRRAAWFGAFLLTASGCSLMHKNQPAAQSATVNSAADAKQTGPQDDTEAFDNASGEPPVNIFGEVGGKSRGNGLLVGDEGFQQHTYTEEGYDADVTLDPTGKWMVFASTRHNQHAGIYVQKVDGTAVTRLTAEDADNAFPQFSPDGKSITFCSTRSGVWNIYTMDLDGRNVVQITSGNTQSIHPTFSPDGTRLCYSALGARSNQWELWTVNLVTGEKRQIGYGLFPNWSPNHSVDRIAFQRARQRGSRWFSLWTLDLVDGEARRVTEVAVSSNAAVVSPSWSPDGKRLVFATILDPNRTTKFDKGQQDIWTINADGSDRRKLTDGNGTNISPTWSPDGRVYFISDRTGTESVWSVRPSLDGGVFTAQGKSNADSAHASRETKENTTDPDDRSIRNAGEDPAKTALGSTAAEAHEEK